MKTSFFAVVLLSLLPLFSAHAEEAPLNPQGTWWVNIGYGAGKLVSHTVSNDDVRNTNSSIIESISINYALFENQFIEVRGTRSRGFLDCLLTCGNEHVRSVQDYGVLYGVMDKTKWYTFGVSAGLAYTEVEYVGTKRVYGTNQYGFPTLQYKNAERTSGTIGLPLEAQLFFTPFKYLGIGFIGIGNLNTQGSMVGGMLALQVGNLR